MIRSDGRFTIFIIEFEYTNKTQWAQISFDVSWVAPDLYAKHENIWNDFSSSGDCWQQTGVHGTFDVEKAIKLYLLLKDHSIEKYKFRVKKVTIWQESEILWGM